MSLLREWGRRRQSLLTQLVKKINAQGMTVIFIDHDMNFVRRIAQRVTVLHYGKIFAEGSLEEIEKNEDVIRIYLGGRIKAGFAKGGERMLKVQALMSGYGKVQVIRGVDIEIKRGRSYPLSGETGWGKPR